MANTSENSDSLPLDQEIYRQTRNRFDPKDPLDLRDFFEAYEKGNPYMGAAIGQLYSEILHRFPDLLSSDAEWFQCWMWAGKRDLY